MLCTLASGVFCLFLWIFAARSLAGCIVFALLCGSVAGVMWATLAPVCAEVVGLALIPSGKMPSLRPYLATSPRATSSLANSHCIPHTNGRQRYQ